jgi:hypothetical protein
MISFLVRFFEPYLQFLAGAAYNIEQTREGLNPDPIMMVANVAGSNIEQGPPSPFEGILLPFGILLLYSILLGGLIVIAAYILGRRRGSLIALLLLALPGVLSTFGFWPYINYLPASLALRGRGILGSPWGMFTLVFMGLLTGWALVPFDVESFYAPDLSGFLY